MGKVGEKQHSPEEQGPSRGTLQASPASLPPRPGGAGGAPRAQLIDRVQFIGGILRDWGWKTEQGPTPNSGANTLKNKPGGSLPCRAGGTLLWRCRGGGSPRCSGDRRSKHVAGQTSRHMVRYQVDGASERRGGGGEARGALGLLSLSLAAVPGKVPPSPALPEAAAPARRSRRLQGGSTWRERKRERKRQAEGGRSFRQGCSGELRAGAKVHRGKGRVRSLEGGGRLGGPRASSRQRGIPQKRPLELHRERKKEQERKREREGESVAAGLGGVGPAGTEASSYGAGVWVMGQVPSGVQEVAGPWAGAQHHRGVQHRPGAPLQGWGRLVPALTHPRKPCRPRWARSPGCSACCCGSGTRRRC